MLMLLGLLRDLSDLFVIKVLPPTRRADGRYAKLF
jgi:hypothetical protein